MNVVARGNLDAAHMVYEVLPERFPVQSKSGNGATPTETIFRGRKESFATGKDAYLWLIEQFCTFQPLVLQEYIKLQSRSKSQARGKRFAQSVNALFPHGSNRVSTPSNHAEYLAGGLRT